MVAEYGHGGVEAVVLERQILGMRPNDGSGVCRALAIITSDGSTDTTSRSRGSYAPVPAPTFRTVRASPSACQIAVASRGSSRRVAL
jgi:hypothetical protein